MLQQEWKHQVLEDSWNKMLREFEKYRQEYRCSTVSNKDKSYPGLYTWCFMQRKNYRENKMPEDKFTLLNNAGFQWNLKERQLDVSHIAVQQTFAG